MSSKVWPEPVAVDPEGRALPAPVEAVLSRTPADNPVMLLLAGPEAHASGWAARMAIRLATDLGTQGRRVVLADLGFDQPFLDRQLGLSSEEGMSDVFLFGASLSRVARQVPGQRFYFATTGAFAGDPAELLAHPRWARILDGFRDAAATLIAYVPVTTSGAARLGDTLDTVIGLASEDDMAILRDDVDAAYGAVLKPAVAVGPAGMVGSRKPATTRSRQLLAAPPEPLTEPGFILRGPRPRERPVGAAIAVGVVVLLAVGMWALFGDRLFGEDAAAPPAAPVAGIVEPTAIENVLGYSVAIESHQTLDAAQRRADALGRQDPGTSFHVAPVPVYGRIWYSVLAGPLADSAAAVQLLAHLVDSGIADDEEQEWAIRPTGWTYQIGEFETRRGAEVRAAELLEARVPTYIVAVDYTAGPPRYRLYAGAYESLQEAEAMAGLLEQAGVTGHSLRRRTGRTGG